MFRGVRGTESPQDFWEKLPPQALRNDLMIYYGPEELYEDAMTVIEMICASVCITSMICFSLEVKRGHMLDSQVHMHRLHSMLPRGLSLVKFRMLRSPWLRNTLLVL